MVGDPAQIRAVAARLRREADEVRSVGARVGAARGVEWRSAAAEAFRDRVTEAVHGERRTAQLLDEAAAALDAHAAGVERTLAELVRLAHATQAAAQRVAGEATDAVQHVVRGATAGGRRGD